MEYCEECLGAFGKSEMKKMNKSMGVLRGTQETLNTVSGESR